MWQHRPVSDIQFRDDPENHRYIVTVDGEQAGMAVYHVRGDRYFFVHTEIDPEQGGHGLGSKLARHVLDDMRARGQQIVPICPFISAYLERHPGYQDLVDQELLDRINNRSGAQTS
jgi:predicted GNAT family acetyltransferase